MNKTCKNCQKELPVGNFYKSSPTVYHSNCKPCHNAARTQRYRNKPRDKKPTGFMKLDESVRKAVLKEIKDGKKYKVIARDHKIGYMSLLRWRDQGQLK